MDAIGCALDVRRLGPFPAPIAAQTAQYYDTPQKLANGVDKNPKWLAERVEQSGSTAASHIGMSPYQDGSPGLVYYKGTGEKKDVFTGNDDTRYGELYEDRVRAICCAVFGVRILETGVFRDRVRRHMSVSLDGETNALRLVGYSDAWPARSERVEWELGKCIWECKCSKRGLKAAPQIPHIMQIMMQMYVRRRHYGFLHYWHRDQTRIWLVRFSGDLWRWMVRRLDLMHMHIARRVLPTDSVLYFPWLRSADIRYHYPGATCADHLQTVWFDVDPFPPKAGCSRKQAEAAQKQAEKIRAPLDRGRTISYAHWIHTLATLKMRAGLRPAGELRPGEPGHDGWLYWLDDVPGGADSTPSVPWDDEAFAQSRDVGQHTLPPKPDIWLVYDYVRRVQDNEFDFNDPPMLPEHNPADLKWFRDEFWSVGKYAEHMLARPDYDEQAPFDEQTQSYPPAKHLRGVGPGGSRMRHLFVERFESAPELDEPDPVDQSNEDTPEERRHFKLMFAEKFREYCDKKRKQGAAIDQQVLYDAQHDLVYTDDAADEHAVKRARTAAEADDEPPLSPMIGQM